MVELHVHTVAVVGENLAVGAQSSRGGTKVKRGRQERPNANILNPLKQLQRKTHDRVVVASN